LRIQSVLGPVFPELERPLQADDSPLTLAAWDSVRQVDVVLAVEDAFGIGLTTAEIEGLRSVGALVEILRRRRLDVEV
jgi:acyl carrier protein